MDYNATRRLHMNSSTDRIERKILLKAPRSRVWRALSNAEEFGNWFGVALKGKTFTAGQRVQGQITYPGYEHIVFDVLIEFGLIGRDANRLRGRDDDAFL